MGLATVGMQHMSEGATEYNEWSQRVMADVGDLVDAIADDSDQKPEDVLREVHGYAAAAINEMGVGPKIAPVPEKKKAAELAPSTEILERFTNKVPFRYPVAGFAGNFAHGFWAAASRASSSALSHELSPCGEQRFVSTILRRPVRWAR